jgi:hypothetical protein
VTSVADVWAVSVPGAGVASEPVARSVLLAGCGVVVRATVACELETVVVDAAPGVDGWLDCCALGELVGAEAERTVAGEKSGPEDDAKTHASILPATGW